MLLSYLTPEFVVGILVVLLTWRLSSHTHKTLSRHKEHEARQDACIKILTDQLDKAIKLLSKYPCITKRNGIWLTQVKSEGSEPPDPVACVHKEDD